VVVVVLAQGSHDEEEEVGLESGLEGGAGDGCCCGCWVLNCEDWVSFMSMCMNMAISRSSGWEGGVWVGEGVCCCGTGVVEVGAGLSLEPSGLGDEEDDCQNQPMVVMVASSSTEGYIEVGFAVLGRWQLKM
jgi:hypothetical protein